MALDLEQKEPVKVGLSSSMNPIDPDPS